MTPVYKKNILTLAFFAFFIFNQQTNANSQSSDVAYCKQAGGAVERMPAVFSTNKGRVNGLSKLFCTFSVDNGFIVIGLETFASEKPSIAATYIKTLDELGEDSELWSVSSSNPSHKVCKNLNGTMIGFSFNGSFTNVLGDADVCVFGDGSMVSAWSLIYMANHRTGYDAIKQMVKSAPLQVA